jgi:hypothetical protein
VKASAQIFAVLGSCAVIAAIVFPFLAKEPAGSMMLGVFALSMLYLARELSRGAKTDRADDADAEAEVGPEHVFPSSWWPPAVALSVAALILGVRFSWVLVAIGAVALLVTGVGWLVQRVHAHPVAQSGDIALAVGGPGQEGALDSAPSTAHEIGQQDHE